MEEESLISGLIVTFFFNIIWCIPALILAFFAEFAAERKSGSYKTMLIIGAIIYLICIAAGIDENEKDLLFGSVLGEIVLIIQYFRIRKENLDL